MTPFKVVVPEMLAVPPTSKRVLVVPPALTPRLPVVISKPVEEEAPAAMVIRPLAVTASDMTKEPAESMVTSPEVVPIVEPSKVRESMVKTPESDKVKKVVPLSWTMKSPVPPKLMLKLLLPTEAEAKEEISSPPSKEALESASR